MELHATPPVWQPWTRVTRDTPWLSFGTAQRKGSSASPATLSKAFCRPCLVYPLASLDVSGQWPVSRAAASPNEVFASIFANHTVVLYTDGVKASSLRNITIS